MRWRWPSGWPRSGLKSVLLSVAAGRLQGQLVEAAADIRGGAVTAADVIRVTSAGMRHATGEGRTVLHALPVSYALDGVKGIRDPRGMVARQFGVDMNVVTVDATVAKNLMLVVERCHLNVEAMAASPYVAGLSVLTDDEADLGAAVVDMGAGTTTIATYSGGRFVHASGFAVGGQHEPNLRSRRTGFARAGFRTVLPYLRGFGDTSFVSRQDKRSGEMVAMAQDAIDLVNALGLETFAVVGHDWGARIALMSAVKYLAARKQPLREAAPGDDRAQVGGGT